MIIFLRVVFALGLGVALWCGVAYLASGERRYLRLALRTLLGTCLLGLVFFAGLIAERLLS
ncbi:MAG: hypothetical protein K0B16_02200 [Burkholderiaceae bacterium]|nr:hypothetical protein [Burkholderiaceae bacterium]